MDIGENEKAVKKFELVIKKNIDVLTNEYAMEYSVHMSSAIVYYSWGGRKRVRPGDGKKNAADQLYPKVPPTDAIQNACPLIPGANEKLLGMRAQFNCYAPINVLPHLPPH